MNEFVQRYLENPSLLVNSEAIELEKLAKQFPFFSMAQILLAKKYQLLNHPDADAQLTRAALTVNDRERLYEFMQEKFQEKPVEILQKDETSYEEKELKHEEVFASNEELHDMLKSIHERKQAFLNSEVLIEKVAPETSTFTEFEIEIEMIAEASSSQSDFSLLEVEEESSEMQSNEANEKDAIENIEAEIVDQFDAEENNDLLVLGEVAASVAEYLPTEFTRQEDSEEEFIIEKDSEIQSVGVIEEEFIARETEFENHEIELEEISAIENNVNLENELSQEMEPDLSAMELQSESIIEEELIDHEVFDSITTSAPIEFLQEDAPDSFHINETVKTPGEFLPEKSYSYSQWLQFFRLSQPPPKLLKEKLKVTQSKPAVVSEEPFSGQMMQQELESIDKIVSAIHPLAEAVVDVISAEELAKKSSMMDDEIVSETLAQIFEGQGHFDKAIRMYVKLSLRFPEKVSFFAARIKELKSKK